MIEEGFSVHEAQDGDRLVLSLRGELDIVAVGQLGPRLDTLIDESVPVLVDLSRVEFIDSTGIACISAAVRRARADGRRLEIGHELRPQVQRLIELVDGASLFWPDPA